MCGSCKEFAPTWDKVANSMKSIATAKINVDTKDGAKLASSLGICLDRSLSHTAYRSLSLKRPITNVSLIWRPSIEGLLSVYDEMNQISYRFLADVGVFDEGIPNIRLFHKKAPNSGVSIMGGEEMTFKAIMQKLKRLTAGKHETTASEWWMISYWDVMQYQA